MVLLVQSWHRTRALLQDVQRYGAHEINPNLNHPSNPFSVGAAMSNATKADQLALCANTLA
jgi:hypothetical protein